MAPSAVVLAAGGVVDQYAGEADVVLGRGGDRHVANRGGVPVALLGTLDDCRSAAERVDDVAGHYVMAVDPASGERLILVLVGLQFRAQRTFIEPVTS